MAHFSTDELDLAIYMAALVAVAEGAGDRITDEQRARLRMWYEAYGTLPETVKLSMKQITQKDLMEHILSNKLGV